MRLNARKREKDFETLFKNLLFVTNIKKIFCKQKTIFKTSPVLLQKSGL